MKPVKPLWGFGWAGWCLLPVLAWLAWSYLFGPDLRFKLLNLINNTAGIKAVYWTVLHPIYYNWVAVDRPGLGWWGLLYMLAAVHIHPRRRVSWCIPLVVWAGLRTELYCAGVLRPGAGVSGFLISLSGGWVLDRESAPLLACGLVDLVLIGLVTRSARVVIVAAVATVLCIAEVVVLARRAVPISEFVEALPGYFWHAAVGGTMLAWAIRARLMRTRPGHCNACGYDRRGLEGKPCPECGNQRAAEPETAVHSPP